MNILPFYIKKQKQDAHNRTVQVMEAINRALNQWGISKDHIHYEVFSPLAILGEKEENYKG